MKKIAITSGEPAGIGPELCLTLARHPQASRLVVLADRELLAQRALQCGLDFVEFASRVEIHSIPLRALSVAGQLNTANAPYVVELIDHAIEGCRAGTYAAMVTAPLHKGILNDAGLPFTGHTEYLAEQTGTARVVMMLAGAGLRVALATTHLPLRAVADAITKEALTTTIRILHEDLVQKFGIPHPRILVAGLNPHAGEGGHMGREEIEVIQPVLEALRSEGMNLVGPLPADTLFTAKVLEGSDAQLAMYHDQGLAVLKYAAFEDGINITLGLPILRTSVDHGTALNLAGTGRADPRSLYAAVDLAIELSESASSSGKRDSA